MMRSTITAIAAAGCILASPAIAQQSDATRPAGAMDDEWVSFSGSVKSTTNGAFTLSHNGSSILVEMDGYEWYQGNPLKKGERVTVAGRIDADFYERKKLEAGSVYVPSRDTYYYANPDDEEGGYYSYSTGMYDRDEDWVALSGTVASLGDDMLRLEVGPRTVEVDISDLGYDPSVKAGDRVTVYGEMGETSLAEGGHIEANAVVRLFQG